MGDSSLSSTMVNCWVAEFKMNQTSSDDDSHFGRLIELFTPTKICKIILADHRMKVSEIAETAVY